MVWPYPTKVAPHNSVDGRRSPPIGVLIGGYLFSIGLDSESAGEANGEDCAILVLTFWRGCSNPAARSTGANSVPRARSDGT